jgi:hypothetical protein
MENILLSIRLFFSGICLGCVMTEALFEHALLGEGREKELILITPHKQVDLIVAIPSFVVWQGQMLPLYKV